MKSQIVSIKKVKNGRYQAELVDFQVSRPGQRKNTLALLNEGDSAFTTGAGRRAWFPVTIESLRMLGISEAFASKVSALNEGEKMDCLIENPTLEDEVLRVQITETVNATEYQRSNVLAAAKQLNITQSVVDNAKLMKSAKCADYIGGTGYFLTEDGQHIFSNTTVELESQVKHTFIEAVLVPEKELAGYGATLAEPIAVTSDVSEEI